MANTKNYRNEFILLLIFIIVNVVMYFFSIDAAPLSAGADAGQYLRPARSLVDYGEFTMNSIGWAPEMGGSKSFTFGTPLYSILLAIPYYFFGQGEVFYAVVVVTQCVLLYLTGRVSRLLLPFFSSNRVILIHALIVFNPNSLITAHLIQSETLFTFFIVITLLYIFSYIKHNSISKLAMMGLFAGLLALTRPAGLYFVYIIPVALTVVHILNFLKNRGKIKGNGRIFLSFFIPVLTAFLIMSPWYIRNYVNTGEYFLSTTAGYYLYDNHIQLLQKGSGYTGQEAAEKAYNQLSKSLKDAGENISCTDDIRNWRCHKVVFKTLLPHVVNQPLEAHIKALLYSWGTLYFTGGASNIRNYLGFDGNSLIVTYQNERFDDVNSVLKLFYNAKTPYFVLLFITMLFVFVVRILAFIGIYKAVNNRNHAPYLIVLFFVLLLFTAMYLYLGQSRFRVPLEPILMLLAVLAFNKNKK